MDHTDYHATTSTSSSPTSITIVPNDPNNIMSLNTNATKTTKSNKDTTNDEEKKDDDDNEVVVPSSSSSDTLLFLAKDGKYYNSYMEQRDANIRYNERHLQSLGLLDDNYKNSITSSIKKQQQQQQQKRRYNDVVSSPSKQQQQQQQPRRHSKRIKNQQSTTTTPSISVDASVDEVIDEDYVDAMTSSTEKTINNKKRRQRQSSSTSTDNIVHPLNDDEIKQLKIYESKQTKKKNHSSSNNQHDNDAVSSSLPDWYNDMETYLLQNEHISIPNCRSVMRQVYKLCTGLGISYQHWENHTIYFLKNQPISLCHNFYDLYDKACEFENIHGRDKGNGWLIRHPIKKLQNFQRYYLQQQQKNK